MITMLKNNGDGTYAIVSEIQVKPGDQFAAGYGIDGNVLKVVTISEVHEQRKEKGQYIDKSDRRYLAKVS